MSQDVLQKLTETCLQKLGVVFESVLVTVGHRTIVAITSADATLLVGPEGEHLRALNLLLRKQVEHQHGLESASFLIDVNGYHEEQMEKVRQTARMLAQRARLFKRDVELEPMTAYERLVIHELFAEDPDIKTESAGEGKFRHIVLRYGQKSAASHT